MSSRRNLRLQTNLLLILHREAGAPYALRLNARKAAAIAASFGALLMGSLCGTLLFFRELEINRKLLDRALDAEVHGRLLRLEAQTPRTPTSDAAPPKKEEATAPVEEEGAEPAQSVGARVGDFSAECAGESCDVNLSLLPTGAGVAKGQLLLVLEAEIPRIGGSTPETALHKRYFLYPGNTSRDDLPPTALSSAATKDFHFTRALHAHAGFTIGKLLRPLAVNAYLFDSGRSLIAHERKVIDTEE